MLFSPSAREKLLLLALAAIFLTTSTGCVGMLAQIGYIIYGEKRDAEYEGLEGKKVAVVCVSGSSSYSSGAAAEQISQLVGGLLKAKIEKVEIISHQEVSEWIDNNDWGEVDYREIGKGVKADMVVAIDLHSFTFRNPTVYRGKADVTVRVIDMKAPGSQQVYRRHLPEIAFPANGGMHTADTTEDEFQIAFVRQVSWEIAKRFYDYDVLTEFAQDPTTLNR